MRFVLDEPPSMANLCDLREAVGWDRCEADYPAAFRAYRTTVAAYDDAGRLVGWCASVGDGVRHLFLFDVIVHPDFQRRGIGTTLVRTAVEHSGAPIVHADFAPEHAPFYERCGFRPSRAGVLLRTTE